MVYTLRTIENVDDGCGRGSERVRNAEEANLPGILGPAGEPFRRMARNRTKP
jgi:hypothetical protein